MLHPTNLLIFIVNNIKFLKYKIILQRYQKKTKLSKKSNYYSAVNIGVWESTGGVMTFLCLCDTLSCCPIPLLYCPCVCPCKECWVKVEVNGGGWIS